MKLINDFTVHGKPGYRYKSVLDKMNRCLTLPKAIADDYGLYDVTEGEERRDEEPNGESASDVAIIRKLFKGGRMFIVPAFFRLILGLKKAKREFAIVFRSFGSDIPEVIEEFNLFCRGNHPMFNGKHGCPLVRFDGKNKTREMLIDNPNRGYMSRLSTLDTTLVLGTLNRHPKEEDPEEFHAGGIDEGFIEIFHDFSSIHVAMQERLLKSAGMAIHDDWSYWNSNGEEADSGKLLLIDQSDYTTQHIFFDDNVFADRAKIVDVRDLITGEVIPHKKAINKYIFQVDPYKAIVEPDYFLKAVEVCEQARSEEIHKIEMGITSDVEEEEVRETEWEKLQACSTEEYLSKVIMPVLLPAMQVLDMERPDDPLRFIAHYVLKNANRVKLPAKD